MENSHMSCFFLSYEQSRFHLFKASKNRSKQHIQAALRAGNVAWEAALQVSCWWIWKWFADGGKTIQRFWQVFSQLEKNQSTWSGKCLGNFLRCLVRLRIWECKTKKNNRIRWNAIGVEKYSWAEASPWTAMILPANSTSSSLRLAK